jgi:gliding motility-associated-like protein
METNIITVNCCRFLILRHNKFNVIICIKTNISKMVGNFFYFGNMKNTLSIICLISLLFFIDSKAQVSSINKKNDRFYFVKNVGQILDQKGNHNSDVLYLLNTNGINVQLRKSGFSYDVYEKKKKNISEDKVFKNQFHNEKYKHHSANEKLSFHRVDIDFLETSDNLIIKEYEVSKSHINYYNITGHKDGVNNVESFGKIVYENIYENINLVFFIPSDIKKPVEYNFVVKPNGDISNIKMKILGADVTLEKNALEMKLVHGKMNEVIPKSWIEFNNDIEYVNVEYASKGKNVFGFNVSKKHNDAILVIDPTPVRQWATYFGGEQVETQYDGDVETDANGNVFISGYTTSTSNIATAGSYQSTYNGQDGYSGYLAKFSSNGDIIWATYYAKSDTFIRGVATDSENNIIVVGETYDRVNISTSGTHQSFLSGDFDGFVVKFNTNGLRIWGTYYGGESFDYCTGVSVDQNDNLFISGHTSSNNNIASRGAFRSNVSLNVHNNWDPFLVKLNKNGKRLWGTYYGGTYGFAVDVDSNGNAYLFGHVQRGEADRENISTVGAYQEVYSDEGSSSWNDTFLVKFNPNGQRVWATFFGGDSYDDANGLVVDNLDNVIICGSTRSNKFKTTNAFQPIKGGSFYDYDAFIAKFNSNGEIQWNSFYGGIGGDSGMNVDVDSDNNIFLAGTSANVNGISTPDAYQVLPSSYESSFITKFNPIGERIWGTFYGGESDNQALDIEVTINGELYLLGTTHGYGNLATSGAFQEFPNKKLDNFLVKFKDCQSSITAQATAFLCAGENIEFSASGGNSYLWSGPNGYISSEQNPIITSASVLDSGSYSVYVESTDGCNDTRVFDVLVNERPIANRVKDIVVCEDVYSSGLSSNIDTSGVESQVLGNQTFMVVKYFDESGNELASPLPNPLTNITLNNEVISVRVFNQNNLSCYDETNFNVIINPIPKIEVVSDIEVCDDNNDGYALFNLQKVKTNIIIGESNVQVEFYHQNGQQIQEPLDAVKNIIPNEELITVRAINTDTECFNETTFKLKVNPLPIANTLQELIGCDDNSDGISEYFDTSNVEVQALGNQTGMEVTYFDALGNSLSSPLSNPYTNSTLNQEIIIVRVTNPQTSCYAETHLVLKTASQAQINTPQNLYSCDLGNGFANFDTSHIKTELINNQNGLKIKYFDVNGNPLPSPLPLSFKNTEPWSQKINVKVENELNNLCYSETSFNLIVNELPKTNIEETYFLCNLEPFLTLNVSNSFNSYNWQYEDGTIISDTFEANLVDAGNYNLTIGQTKNGVYCENNYSFELIRSELPSISNIDYKELSDDNYIQVLASGDGDFEYSIDGINYQNSNTFNNILGGIYTVSVRDKLGCGEDSENVTIIDYPKYFTPNNDGLNDTWQIKGITDYPNAKIFIYDRYGKLLKQINPNSIGWDGTFRGEKQMATDYWFTVKLDETNEFKGHFSLKL